MNWDIKPLKTNVRPMLQTIGLVLAFVIPFIFDIASAFSTEKDWNIYEHWKYILFLKFGDLGLGIGLMVLCLKVIRKFNENAKFATGNVYHLYSYWWFSFCSNILNFGSCGLKNVPIYLQFKLLLNDTFKQYDINEDEYKVKPDDRIKVKYYNDKNISSEINLMIADTYPIKLSQIPSNKKKNYSIRVSRARKSDMNRYKSTELVSQVVNIVRKLPKTVDKINVFATTNPINTKDIVNNAFKLAGRGNIFKVTVFQQSKQGERNFLEKGVVVINFRKRRNFC